MTSQQGKSFGEEQVSVNSLVIVCEKLTAFTENGSKAVRGPSIWQERFTGNFQVACFLTANLVFFGNERQRLVPSGN